MTCAILTAPIAQASSAQPARKASWSRKLGVRTVPGLQPIPSLQPYEQGPRRHTATQLRHQTQIAAPPDCCCTRFATLSHRFGLAEVSARPKHSRATVSVKAYRLAGTLTQSLRLSLAGPRAASFFLCATAHRLSLASVLRYVHPHRNERSCKCISVSALSSLSSFCFSFLDNRGHLGLPPGFRTAGLAHAVLLNRAYSHITTARVVVQHAGQTADVKIRFTLRGFPSVKHHKTTSR